jgi:hypothetical protein
VFCLFPLIATRTFARNPVSPSVTMFVTLGRCATAILTAERHLTLTLSPWSGQKARRVGI